MPERVITSTHNPRVKQAAKLRDKRQRSKQGRILIDGARELLLAVEAGVEVVEVFVCESHCRTQPCQQALERLPETGAAVWHVSPEVFEKLAFGARTEGVIGVALTPERTLADLKIPPGALVAVLVGVEKPGNVGAVLRSADGAGISAVIVADAGTDLYNPNCIRASLGTVFTAAVCTADSQTALKWLLERGDRIFAATLDAERSYTDADYRQGAAIVLGSEAEGLPPEWRGEGITKIKLPMGGAADSLNVSATAAVLFYEARRQRGVDVEQVGSSDIHLPLTLPSPARGEGDARAI